MPRLRTIKPEFWSSEQVMELSRDARLAFIGMWNFCDDNGVHQASAKTLKAEVFPADEITVGEVSALVDELIAQGLVLAYEVAAKHYWLVTGWKHQYIKHPAVKHPLPDGIITTALPPAGGNPGGIRGDSGGNPGGIRGESGHRPVTGRPPEKEKEKDRKRSKPSPASGKPMRGACDAADDGGDGGFSAWWVLWPRKVAKAEAEQAWRKLSPDAALRAELAQAVQRQAASEAWRRDGGKYIPHPATWLNGRRWEDDTGPVALGYSAAEVEVMRAYNAVLGERGWPLAEFEPFSPSRAAAIDAFVGFGDRGDWIDDYFGWLRARLQPLEGYGFDWVVKRETYLRAKEGNFAALREAA